jgi:cyclopropane fatty-acyl-phospholipid synthase-like methyltransferase
MVKSEVLERNWKCRENSILKIMNYFNVKENDLSNVLDVDCGWGGSSCAEIKYAFKKSYKAKILGVDDVQNIKSTQRMKQIAFQELNINNTYSLIFKPYYKSPFELSSDKKSMISFFSSMISIYVEKLLSDSLNILKNNGMIIYTTILSHSYQRIQKLLKNKGIEFISLGKKETSNMELHEWDNYVIGFRFQQP